MKIVAVDGGAGAIEEIIQRVVYGAARALRRARRLRWRLCRRLREERPRQNKYRALSDEAKTTGHIFAGAPGFPFESFAEDSPPLDAPPERDFACPSGRRALPFGPAFPFALKIFAR